MIADFDNIPELPPVFGPARQVAYIVPDIDAAMAHWHDEHGVGPFLVARNAAPLRNAYYRGEKAATARVNIAFAYVGDMQLELIELIGDTPSLYKEAIDRNITGVHHYAVCVDDFPAAYNWALDNGFEAVVDVGVDGLVRMSYVEDRERGLILEVIQWNALTRPYFEGLETLVSQADPAQPVHEFSLDDLQAFIPKGSAMWQVARFGLKKLFGQVQQTRREHGQQGAAA